MSRFVLASLTAAFIAAGQLLAGEGQDKSSATSGRHTAVTIVRIDVKKGEITVKVMEGPKKSQEKTFSLGRNVKVFDETGQGVALETLESGEVAMILTRDGELQEVRRPARAPQGQRLSDAVRTLIELTDIEEGCIQEVQLIYSMLRKLDTDNSGKISLKELEAERGRIMAERIKGHIERLDTNKDGKVSKEEARGLIREHFDRIDRNGDGSIDHAELLQAAKERHAQKASEKK